jgi:hypothetical protein
MVSHEEMLKLAYLYGAQQALEDAGLVKEALIGKGIVEGGKRVLPWLGRLFARGGTKGGKYVARGPLKGIFRGAGRQALTFGTLSGGLSAALTPGGFEDRAKAFVRGFGPGALSGIGWAAGRPLVLRGLTAGLGKRGLGVLKPMAQAAKQPWFRTVPGRAAPIFSKGTFTTGEGALQAGKAIGSKLMLRGLPFGGAWMASGVTGGVPDWFKKTPQPMQMPPGFRHRITQGPIPVSRLPRGMPLGATPQYGYTSYGYS